MVAMTYAIPSMIVFVTSATLVVVGAIGVISFRNPVHSALSLIVTLFGVAVAFIAQSADFLAAMQIIVYAGAIVVLIIFVIMFLGVDRKEDTSVEPFVGQRPFALAGVTITIAGIIYLMASSHFTTGAMSVSSGGAQLATGQANVQQLGTSIFTTYLFSFEATAALLMIAVIGAVVLARRENAQVATEGDVE